MLALSLLSLAAVAVASPISSVQEYAQALDERSVSVTAKDLANFKFYVQHAAAAYCNVDTAAGKAITCGSNACPDVQGDKATVVGSFTGKDTGIGAYVSVDDARKEIVVAIRGSNNIRNWIANLVFVMTDCDLTKGCGVHTGFLAAWKEISAGVTAAVAAARKSHPDYGVITTGHSLGGAVATLAASYLRKAGHAADVYTYGSPRVGDDDFANFVTQQAGAEFRVTHMADPVPRLPPIIFGYRHTAPEYWLTATDAGLGDITVCEGIANIHCNGGTLGLDTDAHEDYFTGASACSAEGTRWKRDDVSDEELEERLNEYSRMDKEYVEKLNL